MERQTTIEDLVGKDKYTAVLVEAHGLGTILLAKPGYRHVFATTQGSNKHAIDFFEKMLAAFPGEPTHVIDCRYEYDLVDVVAVLLEARKLTKEQIREASRPEA